MNSCPKRYPSLSYSSRYEPNCFRIEKVQGIPRALFIRVSLILPLDLSRRRSLRNISCSDHHLRPGMLACARLNVASSTSGLNASRFVIHLSGGTFSLRPCSFWFLLFQVLQPM